MLNDRPRPPGNHPGLVLASLPAVMHPVHVNDIDGKSKGQTRGPGADSAPSAPVEKGSKSTGAKDGALGARSTPQERRAERSTTTRAGDEEGSPSTGVWKPDGPRRPPCPAQWKRGADEGRQACLGLRPKAWDAAPVEQCR